MTNLDAIGELNYDPAADNDVVREPSCCELACYEDEGCACEGCQPSEPAVCDA